MNERLHLWVNGQEVDLPVVPGEMLSDLLRYRLGLTGTKIGCNEMECGACTVLVDGEPVLSCSYPAVRVQGKHVLTIEGLAKMVDWGQKSPSEEALHPLQEAFIKYGALQCGFCTPGQIMTSYALLLRKPEPSDEDIKTALKDTLCRCGAYPSILQAIKAAAKAMKTGTPVEAPQIPPAAKPGKYVGNVHPRPDAVAKVTGRAKYTDDLQFEGMLHARVKRAMVPSAIVKRIDVSKAKALPGVVAVLTAEDIPGERNHGLVIYDWPIMVGVGERVRYVGDAIAIVAAETREIATQALDLIEVEFEPLPVITDPVQAAQPDAPKIHPNGNLLKHIKVRKGDVEQGFAEADVILEHTFFTPMHDHAFLEPECSIARPTPDGRMEVYVGSQIPYADRQQIARALGWPESRVHVVGQLMGGGFGGKEDIAGQIHAALLAHATGRPVKLLFDRHESLIVHPKRHATQIRVKVGAKLDGRLTAVETELYGDTGAYASLGEKVMTRATTHSSGPYEVPHVKADCYAMYTNNPPAGAFRGFGVMQSAFAIESIMDMLAERLGIDPVELRRKNALRVGSVTNTGQVLRQSVGLLECIEKVEAEMRRLGGPNPFAPKPVPGAPHLVRAWGFAVGYKNTGLGGGAPDKAGAEVELRRDGTFQVRTSSAELGQGLPTVLQLIAAEELNQSPKRIDVLLMDTDLTPDGGPTTASRQTFVTGNAVRYAARALKELLTSELSERYDVPPEQIRFVEGLAQINGHTLSLQQVAEEMLASGRPPVTSYTYWAPATRPLGEGGDMHFAFSFAAQAAEVEVNTRTGEVKVLRMIIANDVGYAINPLGLRGQIEGGAIMGIGHALTENFIVKEGHVVTDRLARYRTPSIVHTPEIISFVVEHPVEEGPYGAKGVGEIVLIPTPAAITNAIYNAVGVRVDRLPVDQEMICKALNNC
ncbi:molybdopterin-dependent oxidoreductase [Thermanaerothrix sp. 4228-RoL]|uniref:Molybdopterin-dependent oxidoreductase n=1 Tax=Thermanaerothrix solaris TaxID=3058434 RepID=A0ABU3NMF1_9CHLR|nr:molybdopterin cofactor-binding domain-containing protein [Thermanaerothrix sp. 4228-RoL]MDT8897520.1 molybdopterin-dependent oxidoreductase [Thermanaerothrix sp. 4228-RoL]